MIYLDHNAASPIHPEVLKAMEPLWRGLSANPSSTHQGGIAAARELRKARREVASFLGAQEESEIVFTSGGTESNNAVLESAVSQRKKRGRIVTSAVEHSSILRPLQALRERGGIEIVTIPVSEEGDLDREKLRESLTDETVLVSVMTANNETGVIFPIEKIAREIRERGILFHVDAVQAVGKIPVSLKTLSVDFLSLSAHKFGGPKGIGALYIRKGVPFHPLLWGGSQERGRRAGTENVPGAAGLGAALGRLRELFSEENQKVGELRDYFEESILKRISGVQVNGNLKSRLPNTSNLAFGGVDNEALLILLDEKGVYASSGSACLSGSPEPSHVLKAMGFSNERVKSSVRFSFGPENTFQEVEAVLGLLERFVAHLREVDLEEQHPHPVVS